MSSCQTLWINIQPQQKLCILWDYICNIARRYAVPTISKPIMRSLKVSQRFWWRCRVFWNMRITPCRLVNIKEQDHISDDLNHPEATASPGDSRNTVISSLIASEDFLTAGGEAAELLNGWLRPFTSGRLNERVWDGMGNKKCTYSFGWTSSRMFHLRRGRMVFIEARH